MTQSNGNQPDKIDILIDQVGRLTEVVTIGFQESRETIQAGFAELRTISERQEQNISRLVGIVETLIRDRQNGGT